MDTGPIVGFMASFFDLFGAKSGAFEGALEQAKHTWWEDFEGKSLPRTADAVTGADVD